MLKDINNYGGLYKINEFGDVYSFHSSNRWGNKKRKMKNWSNKDGYVLVTLSAKGKQKNYLLHRLLAQAFIPNPHNKPHIDHINSKPSDNRLSNLRWCTNSENLQYASNSGLLRTPRGENCARSKLTENQAREILLLKGKMLEREVAEIYPVSKGMVGCIWRRTSWKHL